jgi:hypothetical protein
MEYNALYMEVERIYISLRQECTVYDVCVVYIYNTHTYACTCGFIM